MKKTFFALIALFTSFCTYAQFEFNYASDWEYYSMEYSPINYTPPQKVKKIVFEIVNPKTNKTYKSIKSFTEKGKIANYLYVNKNNDTTQTGMFSYDDNGKMTSAKMYNKRKLKTITTYSRNKIGSITEYIKTNAKKKVITHKTWEYDDKGNVTQSVSYKKGTSDILSKWQYEYYEDGKQAKSTLYNGKGKVRMCWTYQCNVEGAKLEKKKKEVQVCKWEKTADNFLIKAYQTFDEKGKVVKYIYKYTIKDTLITEIACYDEFDVLKTLSTYDKSTSKPLYWCLYHKGKKSYERSYKYEDNLLRLVLYYKKGKLQGKSEYKYNENGFLTELTHYNKKNKLIDIIRLSYEI